MEINTALILCAGYGKRLNPVTLNKPKPKQNKGFKNLLKSDKPTIDIETK